MDEIKLQSAREAIAAGRFPEAAAILEPLHKRWPSHPETAHALALAWAQMGLHARALPLFELALAAAPADPALHVNYGTALSHAGRGPEAARILRRALELDPSLAGAHYNLAQVLTAAGDAEGAVQHFREAARLFPGAPTFWRDLGRAEARLGRWEAAIEAYGKATEDEDCHADAKQERALALEKAGRGAEAEAAWRKLLAAAPLMPMPRNHLVAILAERGDVAEAEQVAAAGVAAAPGHADFHHNLGTVRSMRGDVKGALAAFRRALFLEPSRVETAQAAEGLADAPAPRAEIEHFNPFGEGPHRIGTLTFRARSADDLSRALAHAVPALLAALGGAKAELRHVAPFHRGTGRRADVLFDYFDPAEARLAGLTRALNVERWIAGEIAPDLTAVRVRLWTASATAEQSEDLPLDPCDVPGLLVKIAAVARLDWPAAGVPASNDLLHFGYGAVLNDETAAMEHLLAAQRAAPFPAAESELLRRAIELMKRGDNAAAAGWLDRALEPRASARVLFVRGQALFSMQEFAKAEESWAQARAMDGSLKVPVLSGAWMEMKAGRLETAERLFREASADEESAAGGLVGLGCVAMARQDPRGARERFLEALAKEPRLPEALFEMALSYAAEGNAAEAERWGRKLEQSHEGHPLVEVLARAMGKAGA